MDKSGSEPGPSGDQQPSGLPLAQKRRAEDDPSQIKSSIRRLSLTNSPLMQLLSGVDEPSTPRSFQAGNEAVSYQQEVEEPFGSPSNSSEKQASPLANHNESYADDFESTIEQHPLEIDQREELALSEPNQAQEEHCEPEEYIIQIVMQGNREKSEYMPLLEHRERYFELMQGPLKEVVVAKFSLQISRRHMQTLWADRWLNDEIINFYTNLIRQRSEQRAGELGSVHCFDTFFMPRLRELGHAGVKRWTRKVDIFAKDIILIPFLLGGSQWCMTIVDMRTKSIGYYASTSQPHQEVLDALESYLREESLDKRQQPFDTGAFKTEAVPNLPQQENDHDSGVFSCMFAEYVTREATITFNAGHVDYFRKKMVLEIGAGQLWL